MSRKIFASRLLLCLTYSRPIRGGSLSLLFIFVAVSIPAALKPLPATGAFTVPVAVVSAASYGSTLTPDSIASAFGEKLATQTLAASGDADPNTPGIQLPTQLGGTTVEIGGQRAGLFFVSPGQVNFVIPPSAASGEPIVSVRSGDGTVSMGTVKIEPVAPALFTANANGRGVPAAVLLRVAADGKQTFEPVAQLDSTANSFVPRLLNWTAPGERLFLILFLSGARGAVDVNGDGNFNETVHLLLGGQEIEPSFAGKAPGFAGLDQLNAEIPRSLSGRGVVDLSVGFSTQATSNVGTIEIGGAPPSVSVSGFSPATALVGDEITISGAGFASNPNAEQAFFPDASGQRSLRAKVNSAAAGQMKVVVPFGAGSGRITVRSPQNETLSAASLSLRTSISGFLETTRDNPLPGVAVKLRDSNVSVVTDAEGKFILPDVQPGNRREYVIDTSSLPRSLPFPVLTGSLRVNAGRDHHLDRVSLQQATGPSISFNSTGSLSTNSFTPETSEGAAAFAPSRSIQTGGVTFEIDDNARAVFPNGATSGEIFLTVVENSRAPVKLPPGVFSSTIVQLTPLGVRLTPGGKLTFPNSDSLAANAQVRLYRLDQTAGSLTLGQFVEAGAVQVSADGRTVATAPNAIAETSYYFVAIPRPTTTLVGRVMDGATPAGEAFVRSRGQSASTDSLGGFVLRGVPASAANDLLTVEASYQRPGGRVDRVQRNGIAPVLNGVTRVTPDLVLPSQATLPNRPPTLLVPSTITMTEGQSRDFDLITSDPDPNQTVQVRATGTSFVSIVQNQPPFSLRLSPGASTAGSYTLAVTATDNLGAVTTRNIALTVLPQVWVTKTPMPTARNSAMIEVLDGKLYVVGGQIGCCANNLTAVEVYDPATNTWLSKAPLLQARNAGGAAVINGKLYVVGGNNGGDVATLEVYDPATDTWAFKASMPTARRWPAVEAINGLLYVVGGYGNGSELTAVEAYDPATNTWTAKAPLPAPHCCLSSGVINGKLYLAGGLTAGNTVGATMTVMYDPATNAWISKAPIPTPHAYAAGGVINGQFYVVAGSVVSGSSSVITNKMEAYDPITDTWSTKPPIPTGRGTLTKAGVINGKLYVVGGATSQDVATLEVYTP